MVSESLKIYSEDTDIVHLKTIIATAIPKITDEFQSLSDVAWYGSAYLVTVGGFQATWGKVYQYFPLKIMFTMAIIIFELGSLICALAPTSEALIVGRAVGGLGAAGRTSRFLRLFGFKTNTDSGKRGVPHHFSIGRTFETTVAHWFGWPFVRNRLGSGTNPGRRIHRSTYMALVSFTTTTSRRQNHQHQTRIGRFSLSKIETY